MFGTEKVEGLLFSSFNLFHSKVFIVKFHFLWFKIIQNNFFQQSRDDKGCADEGCHAFCDTDII